MKAKTILTFLASQLFFVGLAWLGGFDFDRRGTDVAIMAGFSTIISGLAAFAVHD